MTDENRDKVIALMLRFNELGALLPIEDNFDVGDIAKRTEVKSILLEMGETSAEIERLLGGVRH
jgi:hypothetical protein